MPFTVKSAKTYTDPSKIREVLEGRAAKQGKQLELYSGSEVPAVLHKGSKVGPPGKPDEKSLKKLCEARGMEWRDSYVDRAVQYWASDERVDADGDIVVQNWRFGEFEKNSPMPFSHRWGELPVGKVVDWDVRDRKEADYEGKALYLLGVFAEGEDYAFADTVFRLVESGILKAGSVGFEVGKLIDVEDPEERSELGLGPWGYVLDNNNLLEYSPCTIPANPGAGVIVSRSFRKAMGSCKAEDLHTFRELHRLSEESDDDWLKSESLLVSLGRALWPEEHIELHKEREVPIDIHSKKSPMVSLEKTVDTLVKSVDELRSEVQALRSEKVDINNRQSEGGDPPEDNGVDFSKSLSYVDAILGDND